MRKKLVVLIIVVMLLNTMSAILGNIVFASNKQKIKKRKMKIVIGVPKMLQ